MTNDSTTNQPRRTYHKPAATLACTKDPQGKIYSPVEYTFQLAPGVTASFAVS